MATPNKPNGNTNVEIRPEQSRADEKAQAALDAAAAAALETGAEEWVEDTHPVTGKRVRRKKVGGLRNVLNFKGAARDDKNYHYHIINDNPDKPGRIQEKLDEGYEFVEADPDVLGTEADGQVGRAGQAGRKVSRPVGTSKTGKPIMGYLMRKPLAWHEEKSANNEKELKAQEAGFYEANPANNEFMGTKAPR